MLRRFGCDAWLMMVPVVLCAGVAIAQQPSREDAAMDTIRGRTSITSNDVARISDWVNREVRKLEGGRDGDNPGPLPSFLARFADQYSNSANTPDFRTQLVVQTNTLAAAKFSQANVSSLVAVGLAIVLVDFNRIEAFDALLAGLSANNADVRALCLAGLTNLQTAIEGDAAKLQQVVQTLRQAGANETDSTVLTHVYLALAYNNQAALVFDAYMEILEKRLALRRGPAIFAPCAEVELVEFFRLPSVVNGLSQQQKTQLIGRLAVLFRADAQRYSAEKLKDYYEKTCLERRLYGIEAILVSVVGGGNSGRIRAALQKGGHEQRAEILGEVYKWVGDPDGQTPGTLNAAPWNVPIGAP